MTCKEIRAHFQGDHFAAINPLCKSAAFLEHVVKCGECSRLIEEQTELATCLLLLREGAPAMPASLDTSVLVNYRSYISQRPRSTTALPGASRTGLLGAFRWAAAVAFAVVAAGAVLLFISAQRSSVDRVSTKGRSVMAPLPLARANSQSAALEPVRKKPNSIVKSAKHATPTIPVALPENWSSSGFQALMYCDQLSCPGAMDVIRVQLPSAAVAFGPTSSKASDFVYADVLVGPDGIARGIRVVE
jgi:hypothetical protein